MPSNLPSSDKGAITWEEAFEKFGWNKDGWVFVNSKGRESVKFFISDLLAQTLAYKLKALAKEIEGMKKEAVVGKYCGCDGECFADCNDSYNQAVSQVLQVIEETDS